ncbi:GDCCVxC domain-containing (seleno)protein [Thalassotalea aquiviva]|uniref:GDCCVxC domain-containing (seleno)protein n=1 Tax=Thalassotalea aquiviva TaxID=3242415 RepID=UPI00352A5E79
MQVELESQITCPECGFSKVETMPTNACQCYYQCQKCHILLRPLRGDCCVFCSFGSIKCPPIQLGNNCCLES